MNNTCIHWQEAHQEYEAQWPAIMRHPVPSHLIATEYVSAEQAFKHFHQNTGIIWRGDYHQAKELLATIKRQVRKKTTKTLEFHQYRLRQLQQSRLFQMLLLVIQPNFQLNNPRAPSIYHALAEVFATENQTPMLLPLHLLLGYIGAYEWHKKGVPIEALDSQKIHVPYGVFSPLRGEYISLVANVPLPASCRTAWDIGTGSGVLAAVLAKRGVAHITGTDTNLRAIGCARANIRRLGFEQQVTILPTDLFPPGKADLILCNPPWLPTKANSEIEAALYDPEHSMLRAFLSQVKQHMQPQGQVWLIMSDLAEYLGLRPPEALQQWFAAAGLKVIAKTSVHPRHNKSHHSNDSLSYARKHEITTLWQLQIRP